MNCSFATFAPDIHNIQHECMRQSFKILEMTPMCKSNGAVYAWLLKGTWTEKNGTEQDWFLKTRNEYCSPRLWRTVNEKGRAKKGSSHYDPLFPTWKSLTGGK